MNAEFKVFTNKEMSNELYHDRASWTGEYISGSDLNEIMNTCPAAWRFRKRDDNAPALVFGTRSHTNFESAELFNRSYRRATNPDKVKDLITSQAALAAKLKSFGLKGTSGKAYPDLIKMMVDCGEDLKVQWLIEMIEESQARADGVELVPANDYDACIKMRAVLESIPEFNACINSPTAQRELSIFGVINGVKVKVRIDHIDVVNGCIVITDYKTSQSANPNEFDRLGYNHGYYMKMALQHDLFRKAYPEEKRPLIVRLLVQEKKEPHLAIAYRLIKEHIQVGRLQYMSVIHSLSMCKERDIWPSYANGEPEIDLPTPEFVKRQYKEIFSTNS